MKITKAHITIFRNAHAGKRFLALASKPGCRYEDLPSKDRVWVAACIKTPLEVIFFLLLHDPSVDVHSTCAWRMPYCRGVDGLEWRDLEGADDDFRVFMNRNPNISNIRVLGLLFSGAAAENRNHRTVAKRWAE